MKMNQIKSKQELIKVKLVHNAKLSLLHNIIDLRNERNLFIEHLPIDTNEEFKSYQLLSHCLESTFNAVVLSVNYGCLVDVDYDMSVLDALIICVLNKFDKINYSNLDKQKVLNNYLVNMHDRFSKLATNLAEIKGQIYFTMTLACEYLLDTFNELFKIEAENCE